MMQHTRTLLLVAALGPWAALAAAQPGEPAGLSLEQALRSEDPQQLAVAARRGGDAQRGAILFHQPALACVKCHVAGTDQPQLGPDLSRTAVRLPDPYVVESILTPSKVVKIGFETIRVTTTDGRSLVGLLAEEAGDAVVLRDPTGDGRLIRLTRNEIEERANDGPSIMPEGLVGQLGSRQQFLDLVRYVLEINTHGPARALQLKPDPALYDLPPLPDYEAQIDHAGLIQDADADSFSRGEAIYHRVCANCHGTHDQPGSLPTSPRFAEATFKNGSDPYTMYQTLTRGFGLMLPQTWMVPRQKYDVIHYIREAYLKPHNPAQYVAATPEYLVRLPRGTTRGPEPVQIEPWVTMNYGPHLTATYEVGAGSGNLACKGIAVRLDAGPGGVTQGRQWMVLDHDTLRVAGGWSGPGFMDYEGILFNGRHGVHPHTVGKVEFANPVGPGWADPETGSFGDPRPLGRDGRPYGPLPRGWAHFRGLYHYGNRVVWSYRVGDSEVLELPGLVVSGGRTYFTRAFQFGPRRRDLVLQVARIQAARRAPGGERQGGEARREPRESGPEKTATGASIRTGQSLAAGLTPPPPGATWIEAGDDLRLRIPAGEVPLVTTLWITSQAAWSGAASGEGPSPGALPTPDFALLTSGGPPRWPEQPRVLGRLGADAGPLAVDVLTHPEQNPWSCRLRLTGLDFLPDGDRAAVCSWDGDVWLVTGIQHPHQGLTWQRIASGLFQPLGILRVGDKLVVSCRDQLVRLHDLNGDGETDFYENFNSDHQVTEHFHEFAMGLQTDQEGNLYYAKSARHALPALVPHHGTLLRVSADGQRTDILATGFRAANGVCVNADGSFLVTDQEGHWTPKNRINWVHPGGFYGNMMGFHDVHDSSDDAMQQPLVWITNSVDRSPAELLWVDSPAWGPLNGMLLSLSYGYGKIFVVPYQQVDGQVQGGICELPIPPFPTGIMRGRFHRGDGHLYLCGMYAWAGNQQAPGGLFRLRCTGKPLQLPVGLAATRRGVTITFSDPLDETAATARENYAVKTWSLARTANYGSEHLDEKPSPIAGATLAADRRSVQLELPEIAPTWCMEITYRIRSADGTPVEGKMHNTIHRLAP